jgi:hypothetical protein
MDRPSVLKIMLRGGSPAVHLPTPVPIAPLLDPRGRASRTANDELDPPRTTPQTTLHR